MHLRHQTSKPKLKARSMVASFMAMVMVLGNITTVFADTSTLVPLPAGSFYISSVQINDGSPINSTDSSTGGNFGTTPVDTNVPVNSTFILNSMFKVQLDSAAWDPTTGSLSTTVKNRDLVLLQKSNGEVVKGVEVSNASPTSMKVSLTNPLEYDTNYQLVVKENFTKINGMGDCAGGIREDVIIPFKTEVKPQPTLSKAEVRGNILRLEGLLKGLNLQYNLSLNGEFNANNWKSFLYSENAANIDVANITLTPNSKVMVGERRADGSAPVNTSEAIPVLYASESAPTFSEVTLKGNQLTLQGLPINAVNMEYRIALDGENYSSWKDLTVTSSTATVDGSGLNLVPGKSLVQVRYKANAPSSASDAATRTLVYELGAEAPLSMGKEALYTKGIKVNPIRLNTPGPGEANTVAVRNGSGEKLPTVNNKGFVGEVDDYLQEAGGVYGFKLKGAGNGENNHVKITIPYQLPDTVPVDEPYVPGNAVIDSSKVSIYMLTAWDSTDFDGSPETWQWWERLPTTIDDTNKTATVDITGFDTTGKDIILTVRYDVFPPDAFVINKYARTDSTISFQVSSGDVSGIKELEIVRVNIKDPSDKKTEILSVKDYPGLADGNGENGNWTMYTDYDPKPGVIYNYIIKSATDMLGNKKEQPVTIGTGSYGTLSSMETIVKEIQDYIYANLKKSQDIPYYQPRITFASGDRQDSVTQKFGLPPGYMNIGPRIDWTSDRPDIVKISPDAFAFVELNLPVDAKGNPTEAKVTLTGKITARYYDCVTRKEEIAKGTVTVPITVKWKIVNGEVIIETKYEARQGPDENNDKQADYMLINDPIKNISKAVKFKNSVANTILLKNPVPIQGNPTTNIGVQGEGSPREIILDCYGKTLKADFDGTMFLGGNYGGSFTLKNAVIDMNHKNGKVFQSIRASKVKFENVKIINAENSDYGVVLEGSTSDLQFTAYNCDFPSFKVAAIAAINDKYSHTDPLYGTYTFKPVPIEIRKCTFNGEGKPGYAILNAFGIVTIKDSIFKGYKGNVSTGWNSQNDDYERFTKDSMGYLYKGIPDGSPAAAIFVKEVGTVNVKNNTFINNDNSLLIWTGEKDFSFLEEKPASGFIAYTTVNGVKIDSTASAKKAMAGLVLSNIINGALVGKKNQIVIEDAGDRYHRIPLLKTSKH